MRIVISSGFFAPLHVGHCDLFQKARALGDHLIVIVNNDHQTQLKGSKHFMSQEDRMTIISMLKPVDGVFLSIDQDGSVCQSIEALVTGLPNHEFIFAKGGDRFASNVPEVAVCARLGIRIVDGLGAKIRASSEILAAI